MIKKLALTLIVLVVFAIAAVLSVPYWLPTEKLIAELQAGVKRATGRELRVAGSVDVEVFPILRVAANHVTLSNPENWSGNLFSLGALAIELDWTSVLGGELIVERFVLEGAEVDLKERADGTNNWSFPTQAGEVASAEPESSGPANMGIPIDLSLGKVALVNGVFRLTPAEGASHLVDSVNADIFLPSLADVLTMSLTAVVDGVPVNVSLQLDSPAALLGGSSAVVAMQLDYDTAHLGIDGELSGLVDLFTGDIDASYGDLIVSGNARVELGGAVPKIVAKLASDKIDVDALTAGAVTAEQPVQDAGASDGWDQTPFDLSGLAAVNAELSVDVADLVVAGLQLRDAALRIELKDQRLALTIPQVLAYDGKITAGVTLNGPSQLWQVDFAVEQVNAHPLLQDMADFEKLLGTADASGKFAMKGDSVAALVNSVDGAAKFSFSNGAVRGFNLAAIVRSAKDALKGDFSKMSLDANFDEAAATDFSSLTGSVTANDGIFKNADLLMLSPLLKVSGGGSVELPAKSVDYLLQPRLVASSEGQGRADEGSGFGVPVRVSGKFDNIKFKPDLKAAVKSSVKQDVKDKVESKIKDKLKGLFGS